MIASKASISDRPRRALGLATVAAAAVFALDLALPHGYAVAMAYVPVLVSGLWWPSGRGVIVGAAVCTGLTIVGSSISPSGGDLQAAVMNRVQSIALIWIATLLVMRHRHATSRASELAAIVDASDDAVASVTPEGIVRSWSAGATRLFGWTAAEAVGRPLSPFVPPERADEAAAMLARVFRGEHPEPFNTVRIGKDGRRLDVSVRTSPLVDVGGQVIGTAAILRDISVQRRAEEQAERLRHLESELAHIGRVAMISELASSLAHELSQPLAGVITNGGACQRWLAAVPPRLDEARESVANMIDDAQRASDVVCRIRAMIQRSPPQTSVVDVNALIVETVALAGRHAEAIGASVRTELCPTPLSAEADRVQLQQVVLNLVMNALEATRNQDVRQVVVATSALGQQEVEVVVRDSGPGIAEAQRDRIFEPFYTTKPDGLGLGLSISRSIIERVGGRLWADAQAEGGSVAFVVPVKQTRRYGN